MKIRYFAWLREHIGVATEELDYRLEWRTVADLVAHLRGRTEGHAKALSDMALVRVAVNHDYAALDHPLGDDDEIAFFPPVTGG